MSVNDDLSSITDPAKVLNAFARHAPVGIQIYDSSGRSIYVNERFMQIFGAAPPPSYSVLKDEHAAKAGLLHLIQQAFAGVPSKMPLYWYDVAALRELPEEDLKITRTQGKKCAIEADLIPIFGEDGKVEQVAVIFKDVTAEQTAEKERDDARVMTQSILDETRAVVYVKDLDHKYLFVNGQFTRIFGKRPEEILGKEDYQLFRPEIAGEFRANDLRVMQTGAHLESEEVALHSDGSAHTYVSLKFPLRDSAGKMIGICGISTDISASRRMERELASAKRMESLGIMAGGIAHDFNNVLEIILLTAESLLMTGAGERADWKTSIESMKSSAQSAALLTRRLLSFGRSQPFQKRVLDVGPIVARTTEILRGALAPSIRLNTEIGPELYSVRADPLQIEQILTNLCFNSREAMPDGGMLSVRASNVTIAPGERGWRVGKPAGEFVEIVISDTGTGMSPAIMDRIFEPFFTTKHDGKGAGLGLSTVYGILQNAEGDIAVESSPGRGSVFRVILPRFQSAARRAESAAENVSLPLEGTETILLVEDNSDLRNVTTRILEVNGYKVLAAEDADSALEIWKASNRIDLVVTDMVMPGVSGMQMLELMGRSRLGAPGKALIVSAYTQEQPPASPGGEDYQFLSKPYTATELLRTIRRML